MWSLVPVPVQLRGVIVASSATAWICVPSGAALRPESVTIADVAMDVRTGGSYHIVMQKEDGERLTVRGTYRDVQPAKRLSMTWKWEEDDPTDEYATVLTIEFAPVDGGTELTLTHEGFQKEQNRSDHEDGWTSILDKLTKLSGARRA